MARKRPKRTAEEAEARRLVRERSGGTCEGCGQRPAVEWSHRVARSQGGLWLASNGLHLCSPGGCHDAAHHRPEWARGLGWMVRRGGIPAFVPARLAGHGWVLLDDSGGFTPADELAA